MFDVPLVLIDLLNPPFSLLGSTPPDCLQKIAARRLPKSKSVSVIDGPTVHNRLGQRNNKVRAVLSTPPEADKFRVG